VLSSLHLHYKHLMQHRFTRMILALLFLSLPLTACDSGGTDDAGGGSSGSAIDITDTATIAGTYSMVSMTDLVGESFGSPNLTIPAGEPTSVTLNDGDLGEINATVQVDGTFVFTRTTYDVTFSIAMSIEGFGNFSDSTTDAGTYTVSGGQMSIMSNDPDSGETVSEVFTISADGNRLTMSDDESRFVLEKQ
jgi:hypothetical protein